MSQVFELGRGENKITPISVLTGAGVCTPVPVPLPGTGTMTKQLATYMHPDHVFEHRYPVTLSETYF